MHPYAKLPKSAYWRTAVARKDAYEIDPVVAPAFKIDRTSAIVTAGSCFAANVSRFLVQHDYNYVFTETLHPFFATRGRNMAKRLGLGDYSAAYGNIYTPRQMLQLIDRAWGRFQPEEDRWHLPDGRIVDVFRPAIEFMAKSEEEFEALRAQHFAAVRKAFERCEVFVFTLGLTEAFVSAKDGAVFPVCPGVVAGEFDSDRHTFINFSVDQIIADTKTFIAKLREINPDVRIVLTVSPVPLVATATGEHVLTATTYSKSVLRVAAGQVARDISNVVYFPSYEIVTGPQAPYEAFEKDRRSVSETIVRQVMSVFFRHLADDEETAQKLAENAPEPPLNPTSAPASDLERIAPSDIGEAIAMAECEEELTELMRTK